MKRTIDVVIQDDPPNLELFIKYLAELFMQQQKMALLPQDQRVKM